MALNENTTKALKRPLKILGIVAILVLIAYFIYSWVAGYTSTAWATFRGQVVPNTDKVHLNPIEAIANFGTYFPQFLPKLASGVGQMLFLGALLILQFAALFWFLSRGRTYAIFPGEYDVNFDDVRGQPAIVDATKQVVKLFQGFKDFRARGGYPPHGILFEGPPGTGKTLLGKAIAGETNVPFIYASGTSFSNMFVGVGNLRVASLFRKARRYSDQYGGAVIFIDELDAVGGSRGGVSSSRDAALQSGMVPRPIKDSWARYVMPGGFGMGAMLVNELLVQMDGLVLPSRRWRTIKRVFGVKPKIPTYNILIIGATNQASTLDPALLRPGRFDRKVHVGLPAAEGRKDILQYYLAKVPHEDLDMEKLANATLHYSPAQIKNMINEALILALQDGREKFTYEDIIKAKLIDDIGLQEPVEYSQWEKESVAIHESGHAIASYFLYPGKRVQVITIRKRGGNLGLVQPVDLEERFSETRGETMDDIKMMLAGLVAENIWYGKDMTSSGAASDLRNATMFAAKMVAFTGQWENLVSLGAIGPSQFGDEAMKILLQPGPIRDQVEEILQQCRKDCEDLLRRKAHAVEVLRDYLVAEEEITGDRFEQIMEALGEVSGGESVAHRKPPAQLAPHRPRPPAPVAVGNGASGDGASGNGHAPTDETAPIELPPPPPVDPGGNGGGGFHPGPQSQQADPTD